MSVPSITDPTGTTRPAPRGRPYARLRAVPNLSRHAVPAAAPPAALPDPVVPVPSATTAPPAAQPAMPDLGAPLSAAVDQPAAAPLTVTISVDGGRPEARDRLLAALRDVVAMTGVAVAGPPQAPAGEPGLVHLDPRPRAAFQDGRLLELSRLEYDLLLFLARHPRQVFSRDRLLQEVWGHVHTGVRTVDVHVSRLRQKLGGPGLISTVRGVGYRLADAAPVRVVAPRADGVSWTA